MRRKADRLVPLEVTILAAGLELQLRGEEFHGFRLAKWIQETGGGARGALVGHGSLYKALGRLEERGIVESRWEDPAIAAAEARPLRRLYRVTPAGERAHEEAAASRPVPAGRLREVRA